MPLAFFLLFVFLKQFYLLPSGNVGVADVCLAVSFAMVLARCVKEKKLRDALRRDKELAVFLALVAAINAVYAVAYKRMDFLRYSVYWIYNGCAIWLFRELGRIYGKEFFQQLNRVVKINIGLQMVVFLAGRGRIFYEYWGGTRYMGTFNDPNQLAFFLFMMILLAYLYACYYEDRTFGLFYILAAPVIAATKSTGILLGFMVFTVCMILHAGYRMGKKLRFSRKLWICLGMGILLLGAGALICIWPPAEFDIRQTDYNMLTRIQEKIWKVTHGGLTGLFLDRGLDKLLYYPRYLLYGAGEGAFDRFPLTNQIHEIHSSFFSIWFCYGIIPNVILLCWIRKNLKMADARAWCAVAGLIVESFLLVNYRQPMFWMILLYADVQRTSKRTEQPPEGNCYADLRICGADRNTTWI